MALKNKLATQIGTQTHAGDSYRRTVAGSLPEIDVLFLNEETFSDGVVGVAVSGDVLMDTVVAQGGRAVGPEFGVTRCRQNILFELDGRPALEVFHTPPEATAT